MVRSVLTLGCAAVAAACASGTPGDSTDFSRSPEPFCQLLIENGTGHPLAISYQAGNQRGSLDETAPGQSATVGVPCGARVLVTGNGASRNERYHQRVQLRPGEATTVARLTAADRAR